VSKKEDSEKLDSYQQLTFFDSEERLVDLSKRHKEILVEVMKICNRTKDSFIFGPAKRSFFKVFYEALEILKIGYHASYPPGSKSNVIPEEIFVHVDFRQANQLSQVLADLGVESESKSANQAKIEQETIFTQQQERLEKIKREEEAQVELLREKRREKLKVAKKKRQELKRKNKGKRANQGVGLFPNITDD